MHSLAGKTVLITGTGCGIGQLMARAAAAEKANLALIDINAANLKKVEAELQQFSGRVIGFTCDISDRKAVAAVSQTIKDRFGHVDVLINNAGIVIGKSFTDLTLDEMQRTMDTIYEPAQGDHPHRPVGLDSTRNRRFPRHEHF